MPPKNKNEILPLQWIKGIGPRKAEAFAKEGITTPEELLNYFPRAYIDRNAIASLKALAVKLRQESAMFDNMGSQHVSLYDEVIVVAKIESKDEHTYGRNRKMLKVQLGDGSGGYAEIIFWNYTDYYNRTLKTGQYVTVSGKVELNKYNTVAFNHPEIEKFDPEDEKIYMEGKILPVYRLTQGLKNAGVNIRMLRQVISNIIDKEIEKVDETLPSSLLKKYRLPDKKLAVRSLHFPENKKMVDRSRVRMKFEEIFFFEVFLALRHHGTKLIENGPPVEPKSKLARSLVESLPFDLTGDQKKVIREIMDDMNSGKPMNRLLQGDVGSGKTIVALLCMLAAIDHGYQTAIMAPTEILAEQHFHTFKNHLEKFGIEIVQLLGGQRKKVRAEIMEKITTGKAKVIVGTHAMFETSIIYNNLGLVIIDEQHRFGVQQRADLKKLGADSLGEGFAPHILVMSATPIPRTLSMTVYGDLDVSVIKEMPKNRKPIKTRVAFESQLGVVYDFIRDEVKKGHQAYIVYPLVEKSDKLEYKAATESFEKLNNEVFPELKLGLLHGQMFWYEKEDAMKALLNKEYHILVATTVIEVGIDVPNATVMLIENAERFGLSQLHQLRGRVGRGGDQSYCILATKDNYRYVMRKKGGSEDERKANIIRLKTMERTTDGFEIAKVDLELRGPGDFLGTKQSGLPNFKFLNLVEDGPIIEYARKEAYRIVEIDPQLRKPENLKIRQEYIRLFHNKENFYDIA